MERRCAIVFALAALTGVLSGCAGVFVVGGAAGAASVASDSRSAGTILDDQTIEFRIANQIASERDMAEKTNISVTSYNMMILLTGEAKTPQLRSRAFNIARNDSKARKVYNEIQISEPLPLKARNFDSWLTTKVKSALVGTKDINALNIKVVTSNTTVYLLGIVPRKQGQIAAETSSKVEGVTKVVKAFEYTD